MAVKVLAEHSTTEDVTTQVVDLGARIANLQATERALQSIMDKATAIKDVLAVQAELTTVRGQIEQMTAEKNHLVQQAAMSTLAVTFDLKPNPVKTEQQQFDPAAEAERASANLVSGLQSIATAGIWFVIVWVPALLFLGVVLGIVYLGFRRVRRMGDGDGGPPEPIAPAAEGGA
jgi:cobalamin biosynthesis Mg chelatase CobN